MEFPAALETILEQRHGAWWKQHYEEAVARIEDHANHPENPYYHAPTANEDAFHGPVILDEFGGESTPEDARRRAFELLVLADLAPLSPAPVSAPQPKGRTRGVQS